MRRLAWAAVVLMAGVVLGIAVARAEAADPLPESAWWEWAR